MDHSAGLYPHKMSVSHIRDMIKNSIWRACGTVISPLIPMQSSIFHFVFEAQNFSIELRYPASEWLPSGRKSYKTCF